MSERDKLQGAPANELEVIAQTILRVGDIGTFDWHLVDGWARMSDSYFAILGFEPQAWEESYEAWTRRVHPDDIGRADRSMQALLSGRSSLYEADYRTLDAQDQWRWVFARAVVTEWSPEGQPARITGTVQDIHRLKLQEEQLRRLQQTEVLGQLTAGIAHDFNNLLLILYGNLDVLRMDARADQVELMDEMSTSLKRASDLTDALLRYVRRREAQGELIELGGFLRSRTPLLQAVLASRVRLELDVQDEPLWVEVESSGLANALINLVINARHAIEPKEGTVRIEVSKASDSPSSSSARIVIRDDGSGMDEATLRRATEAFFTTKKDGQGTGLGLAMVDKHMDESSGTLKISSTLGAGTVVQLSYPLAHPVSPAESDRPSLADRQIRGSETILVVDDEQSVLRVLSAGLEPYGFRVLTAENPRRALAKLANERVDLVLTDIVMPYTIDGLELGRRVKDLSPETPLLFMTGYARDEDVETSRTLGHLIWKPFSMEALGREIRRLLDQTSLARSRETWGPAPAKRS